MALLKQEDKISGYGRTSYAKSRKQQINCYTNRGIANSVLHLRLMEHYAKDIGFYSGWVLVFLQIRRKFYRSTKFK